MPDQPETNDNKVKNDAFRRRCSSPRPRRSAHWIGPRGLLFSISVVGMIVGCSKASTPASGAVPPKPFIVKVTITDNKFYYVPDIPVGRVVFKFYNASEHPHNILLFPEASDAPPIDVQLHGTTRRLITVLAEIFVIPTHQAGVFALDLIAGQRYAFMSRWVQMNAHQADYLLGLDTEFVAGSP